jgi:hypothetical protein
MSLRITSRRMRRPLATTLVCALLLAQALGLLHRLVHAHPPHPGATVQAAAVPATASLEALFANHHDEADCQVFDQLSQGDALAVTVVDAETLRLAQPLALGRLGCVGAARVSFYLARAPPGAA